MSFKWTYSSYSKTVVVNYRILHVKNDTLLGRVVLWLTWGRRESYPKDVGATPKLWLAWFLEFPWLTRPFLAEDKPEIYKQTRKINMEFKALTNRENTNAVSEQVASESVVHPTSHTEQRQPEQPKQSGKKNKNNYKSREDKGEQTLEARDNRVGPL